MYQQDEVEKRKIPCKRGPYLQYLHVSSPSDRKVPRSSKYYWKRKKENNITNNNDSTTPFDDIGEYDISASENVDAKDSTFINIDDNTYTTVELCKQDNNDNQQIIDGGGNDENDPALCDDDGGGDDDENDPALCDDDDDDVDDDDENDPALCGEDDGDENESISSSLLSDDSYSSGDDEYDDEASGHTSKTNVNEMDEDDRPVYKGSRLTVSVSIMLIMTFIMRHHLTGTAVDDLIALIEAHMIVPNLCKTTMKLIRRFFIKMRGKAVFHYFCEHCMSYIGPENRRICEVCKRTCNGNTYFLVIPLLQNLQSLFQYKDFLKDLSYPKSRVKTHEDNIEDIIDGEIYKKHFGSDGFLHGATENQKRKEIHMSLQCNTDGVKIFKSSKVEIWPVYYTINELSPSLRYQRKYRLFAGLWFSDKKPDFKTFLKPFVEELKEFGSKGQFIETEEGKKLVKVFLLSGIFDAPAKSMFQNIVQFNGLYGCSYCLESGETCKTGAKGHVHIFPFNFNSPSGHALLRTHDQTIQHAKEAQVNLVQSGKINSKYGIKGLTWSMAIPAYDVVEGLGLDYLHNTLLGVVKMLMKLWFNKKYKNMPWYVGDKVSQIDLLIKNLKLPNLISRVPRNIEHDFKHFKGSEFRSFLLFYSAPILYDFLPEEYFQHYVLLVQAIFLLLKESVSLNDLKRSSFILQHFCMKVARLYGDRYQTYNVHNLLHMPTAVKLQGPLWAQSAFWYEDYNGDYKHLFHGTQNVNIQIVTNTIVQHKIPEIVRTLTPGSVAFQLYHKMTVIYHQRAQNLGSCIIPGIHCVGNQTKAVCCPVVTAILNHQFNNSKNVYTMFKRIYFHGYVLQSQSYQRVTKRNTYTIKYHGRFGIAYGFIKYFLKLNPSCSSRYLSESHHYLAVVDVPNVLKRSMSKDTIAKLEHMIPVSLENMTIDVCFIKDIKDICCYVSGGNQNDYIVLFPNRIERD